jgi:hypothetical protein
MAADCRLHRHHSDPGASRVLFVGASHGGLRRRHRGAPPVRKAAIGAQYGTFSRSFSLPENVDASKISAAYVNGILEITIPKDEKKVLKTTIKVG